ncbi:MAG: hypothetical protein H7Z15_05815 [Rhizobacter sp.]|nr:hypothetical protein [Rhizobacter sp.]
MRTLTRVTHIDYLVSRDALFEPNADLTQALGLGQRLFRFAVLGSDLKKNTVAALWAMVKLFSQFRDVRQVFFFDMDLVSIAKWWPVLGPLLRVKQLSLLYLMGPEQISGHPRSRRRVERLLRRHEVVLCLRTSELRQDWVAAFPDGDPERIRTLPSLEIPEGVDHPPQYCQERADVRFGLLGQLRRGKSIDALVPIFSSQPEIGKLKIAGSFASPAEREALSLLQGLPGFEERYLSDDELLQLTAAQDYIVILYDHWDKRMESAVLYLAMRANRPVLVYAEGWCDRMIREFGCGLSVGRADLDLRGFLASLPLPGSSAYAALIEGVQRFRQSHRTEALLPNFFGCIGFGPGVDARIPVMDRAT